MSRPVDVPKNRYRKLAQGQLCMVRWYGCDGGGESTSLAHFRLLPYCGVGIKPDDVAFGAWACANCARATAEGSPPEARHALALGVMRTVYELRKLGELWI
jgi:hypothetical protein